MSSWEETLKNATSEELEAYRRAWKEEQGEFEQAMGADEPLILVLRGHLWIEFRLLQLVERALARPTELDLSRYAFPQKVDLAVALGLISASERPPLLAVNRVRNRLAHDLAGDVTPEDERTLVRLVEQAYPFFKDHFKEERLAGAEFPRLLLEALGILFVTLHAAFERTLQMEAALADVRRRAAEVLGRPAPPPGKGTPGGPPAAT